MQFFLDNYQWIFSGVGLSIITIVFTILFRRRSKKGESIETKGHISPGIVHGDYTVKNVNIDNSNKVKHTNNE